MDDVHAAISPSASADDAILTDRSVGDFLISCGIFGFAAVLVGQNDRLLGMNDRARSLVAACFEIVDGRVVAKSADARERLHTVIAAAALERVMGGGSRPAILPRASGRPVIAHVVPTAARFARIGLEAAVLILIDPDETREPASAFLKEAFGLSTSEIALARYLFRGMSLKAVAEARQTSIATLRVQLSSVFAKTGTKRQAELVSLLARLPPFG